MCAERVEGGQSERGAVCRERGAVCGGRFPRPMGLPRARKYLQPDNK